MVFLLARHFLLFEFTLTHLHWISYIRLCVCGCVVCMSMSCVHIPSGYENSLYSNSIHRALGSVPFTTQPSAWVVKKNQKNPAPRVPCAQDLQEPKILFPVLRFQNVVKKCMGLELDRPDFHFWPYSLLQFSVVACLGRTHGELLIALNNTGRWAESTSSLLIPFPGLTCWR